MNEEGIIEFHVDARELDLLRKSGRFTTAFNETRGAVRRGIREVTALIEQKLKDTFEEEHPHKERDYADRYHPKPTVDTFKVVPAGMMTFNIIMAGGAVYIEKGWAPHFIVARNSSAFGGAIESNLPARYNENAIGGPAMQEGGARKLRWSEDGTPHFATMVWNPGYEQRPFVNKVLENPEVQAMIARLGRLVAVDFKMRAFSPLTGEEYGADL